MTSREKILSAVLNNQPAITEIPLGFVPSGTESGSLQNFKEALILIGGKFIEVGDIKNINEVLRTLFPEAVRKISMIPALSAFADTDWASDLPHSFENVDVAVLTAHFGVAENGALWLTEALMGQRIVPFICQELVVILNKADILSTMHDAYARIADVNYGFGVFVAGPSKTADIEQSLVHGAHGPKRLTVLIIT